MANREIDFGFVCVSCVPCVSCERARRGEAAWAGERRFPPVARAKFDKMKVLAWPGLAGSRAIGVVPRVLSGVF